MKLRRDILILGSVTFGFACAPAIAGSTIVKVELEDDPTTDDAVREVALLRAESAVIPALELERLRNRQVVFFLDAVAQYVDAQPELRQLPQQLGDGPGSHGQPAGSHRGISTGACHLSEFPGDAE